MMKRKDEVWVGVRTSSCASYIWTPQSSPQVWPTILCWGHLFGNHFGFQLIDHTGTTRCTVMSGCMHASFALKVATDSEEHMHIYTLTACPFVYGIRITSNQRRGHVHHFCANYETHKNVSNLTIITLRTLVFHDHDISIS
jgi:hypothetical protein